jgi:hypothetical protein
MSYTITISGSAQPGEGQTQEKTDSDVTGKARAFAATLPGVSAAFIQTISGGMESLAAEPPAPPATPAEPTGGTESG